MKNTEYGQLLSISNETEFGWTEDEEQLSSSSSHPYSLSIKKDVKTSTMVID